MPSRFQYWRSLVVVLYISLFVAIIAMAIALSEILESLGCVRIDLQPGVPQSCSPFLVWGSLLLWLVAAIALIRPIDRALKRLWSRGAPVELLRQTPNKSLERSRDR